MIAKPKFCLSYSPGAEVLVGLVIRAVVLWSSLKLKRRKIVDLVWGNVLPIVSLGLSVFLILSL